MHMKWIAMVCMVAAGGPEAIATWTPLQTDFGPYLRIVGTNDSVAGLRLGLFSENDKVYGVSASFWTDTIRGNGGGLQFAVWRNEVERDFTGVQAALWVNDVRGTMTGISIALQNPSHTIHGLALGLGVGVETPLLFLGRPVTEINENATEEVVGGQIGVGCSAGRVQGLQLGGIAFVGDCTGIHAGLLGGVAGDVSGLGLGCFHLAGSIQGVQLGGIAVAEGVHGLQLGGLCLAGEIRGLQAGVINRASDVHGVQLGLVNWTETLRGLQVGLLNFAGEEKIGFMPLLNAKF